MNLLHYRDLIIRAVREGGASLELLAAQMDDAAQAKATLQAKGYGAWKSMTSMAAQVPEVRERQRG